MQKTFPTASEPQTSTSSPRLHRNEVLERECQRRKPHFYLVQDVCDKYELEARDIDSKPVVPMLPMMGWTRFSSLVQQKKPFECIQTISISPKSQKHVRNRTDSRLSRG